MRRLFTLVGCSVMGLSLLAADKAWHPTVLEGGVYKMSNAANWLRDGAATTAPTDGESVIFDSSSAAIAAYNDRAGLQLLRVTIAGSQPITLTGEKLVLCDQGGCFAENASLTVTFNLPLELAGNVCFSSISEDTTKSTTYDFQGVIGDYGSLTGTFATGGDFSGIYNFRGANTYSGNTYLTNGLSYRVYSNAGFGTGAVYYRVPSQNSPGTDRYGNSGGNFDKYYSTIYFHGVTLANDFYLAGLQMRDLVFVSNTTNKLTGRIELFPGTSSVERWEIQSGASAVLTGPVAFNNVAQLNVMAGGSLIFSNEVVNTATIRAAASGSGANLGTIVFANRATVGALQHYGIGRVVLAYPEDVGATPKSFSYVYGGATLEVKEGRQSVKTFTDATSSICTSADGSTLRVTAASGQEAKTAFRGNVSLQVEGGVQNLSGISNTTGDLIATNGGQIVMAATATWKQARVLRIHENSSVTVNAADAFRSGVEVVMVDSGRLSLAAGAEIHASRLTVNGVSLARNRSYGATGSGADVIDDVHFIGTGKLVTDGSVSLTWTGAAGDGKLATAANWSPASVPQAGDTLTIALDAATTLVNDLAEASFSGITFTGTGECAIDGTALGVQAGGTFSVDGSTTLTLTGGLVASGADTITLTVASGAVVKIPGVISGAAPIALTGTGTVYFSGANTFTGNLTVNCRAFHAVGDGVFGTTDGTTTFRRLDASSYVYFDGGTTAEYIYYYNTVSSAYWYFTANTRTVFNGKLECKSEQFRFSAARNAEVIFNADFGNIGYLTPESSTGAVYDFNCSFTGGYPRPGGVGTYIFRKPSTYNPRSSNYCLDYMLTGILRFAGDYVLPMGNTAPVFATANASTIDLDGHDQGVAQLVGVGATITSDRPATLHVLNNYNSGWKGNVFSGSFAGQAALSCEGTQAVSTVTLAGVSTSSGALTASNGCTVVITASGRWSGPVNIAADSVVTLQSKTSLNTGAAVNLTTGGRLNLDFSGTTTLTGLSLDGVALSDSTTYGAVGSGAAQEIAGLSGSGILYVEPPFIPETGETRTWCGPVQGTWSTAANWNPAGVPAAHDILVFNANAAAVSCVNDLTGLTLNGLSFTGDNPIALTGQSVMFARGSHIVATSSSATIDLGLAVGTEAGTALYLAATSNQSGHVVWNLTGGLTGEGDIHTAGDNSAEIHFRAASPSFDGNLILTNAAAYHVWNNGALGSTAGYTLHAVCRGDYSTNIEKWYAPLWLHGVTLAENLYLLSYSSFGLSFADNTTNVLSGTIDVPLGYYTGSTHLDAERWWVGTNACVTLTGAVGLRQLADSTFFEHLIPYAQPGSSITFTGGLAAQGLRANGAADSVFVLNTPISAFDYFGNYGSGTVVCGCTNILGAVPTRPYMFAARRNFFDLNGYDQTFAKFDYVNNGTNNMQFATFTSTTPATLHLACPYAVAFSACCTGALSLSLESPQAYTLTAANTSSGTLVVTNGATVAFSGSGAWVGAQVIVAADSTLNLATGSLSSDVTLVVDSAATVSVTAADSLVVGALVVDGEALSPFRTYGAPGSGADVTLPCFSGLGRLFVVDSAAGQTRTWKGGMGNWSTAANWTPSGVPQSGDVLVFDAAGGDVAAVNDLSDLTLRGMICTGANVISLTGNAIGLMDAGEGIVATNDAAVTVACAVASCVIDPSRSVTVAAAAGASLRLEGVLSGAAAWRVKGAGRVDFAGANTFTGPLAVGEAVFHAWGTSPFGSAEGKTSFSLPSGTTGHIHFHGVQTEDLVEWYQNDGQNCGTIYAGEPTIFKGVFKGTGGQPRWILAQDSVTIFSNKVVDVGAFTLASGKDSVLDITDTLSAGHLRFSGTGRCYVHEALLLNGASYSLGFNDHAAKTIYLLATNVLRTTASYEPIFGAAPLMIDGGTVDLCGNWQRSANLLGGPNAVVTSSSGPTTLHVLQTSRGNFAAGSPIYYGAYNGVVTGPVTLSIEGNPNPAPREFSTLTTETLVPTQYLTAVSTATGSLIASNSAVVAFTGDGAWAGTNIVVHANSKILLDHAGALAREAEIHLNNDEAATSGKLVLGEGVVQRCQWLYVNGVRQPRGWYGSTTSGATIKNDAFFEGTGVLRVMGDVGMTINFR